MQRITFAAIKYNGQVYTGFNHPTIGRFMVEFGICDYFPAGKAQGFITNKGKFVSRVRAMRIAINAGQVIEGETSTKKWLFSEDLRKIR